jgi:hypothetical protein
MRLPIRLRCLIATLLSSLSLGVLAPWVANATPVSGEIFYTQYQGTPNVSKVSFDFDGTTFTLGTPTSIGTTVGADGIAGNPQNANLLLVGGQGPRINTISKSTGTATPYASPVNVYHLEVSNSTTVFGSGIPGFLARHTINADGSLSAGTTVPLSGDNTTITQLITTPSGFFYTSSGAGGSGDYGSFNLGLATATTTQLWGASGSLGGVLPAAHGGVYDPFTNSVIIMGDSHVTQLDLAGNILSDLILNLGGNFDQGTVDGEGHLFAACNCGDLLFLDYSASGLVSDASNFTATPFLADFLDDVAPLVGAGRTGGGSVPEPTTVALIGLGLVGIGLMGLRSRRRKRQQQ